MDIKVVSRSRDKWVGVDQFKNEYSIMGFTIDGNMCVMVIPTDPKVVGVLISKSNKLCE